MATTPVTIRSQPGIKRDGTRFEGDFHVDGQWVRWQRGLPRKIGGYTAISRYLSEISRGLKTFTQNSFTYFHSGSAGFLERFLIDSQGATSLVSNRTPSTLAVSDDNIWQFDILFDGAGIPPANKLIAQVAPNASCLCNVVGGQIFIGDLTGTAPLQEITIFPAGANVSGGVCVLHPYLTYFGADGFLGWSKPGDPTDLTGIGSGQARIAAEKIVRGLPLRGGPGNAPSGLYWSSDAVIRGSFIGGNQVFQFDTISSQSSILSAASVIEYDGIYFWCGTDRFMMFNGVVREVPNNLNLNYFFDGLNRAQGQRVFAYKVPRYGEIWWCYPRGDAVECTHAVVYNVREQTWYDTELPNSGRSAGEFSPTYGKPLLTGVNQSTFRPNNRITETGDLRITEDGDQRIIEAEEGYLLWQHETGVDEIDGQNITAVPSFFETADMSLMVGQGVSKWIRVEMVEPDFVQSQNMTIQLTGRTNAKAGEVAGPERIIYAQPTDPYEQVVWFKEERRELRFRFTSNTIGGDYQMGQVIAHIEPADGNVLGAVAGPGGSS
jgi:hypothetical protein